ncbi:MAG: hypothetical protein KBT27_15280 [Prevotellaceae bacterium]|nr:hypothetical protein [Candidatus Faecinaster equi]
MAVENNVTKNITDVPDKELCTGAEQVIVNDAGKMVMMPVENVHAIADCAKADATQAGFIANKPFYESEPENTLIASYDASTAWMYSAVINPDDEPEFPLECAVAYGMNIGVIPELRRGQKYTVIFDGEEYCGTTISCYDSIMLGSNRNLKLFIGGEGGIEEDDDIPFGIVIIQDYGLAEIFVIYYDSTTFNHSIALFTDITNIQTIDYKYFPDGYPYIEQEPVLIWEYVGSFDNEYGYVEAPNLLEYELNVDSAITLTIDGASTTFTAKDMHFYGDVAYMGNGALLPEEEGLADTGEDFCVIIKNRYTIMALRDKKNEHTVSISGYQPVYHKIDSRLVGVNMSEYLTKREGDETYLSSGSYQYYTKNDMAYNYVQKGQLDNLINPTDMANAYITKDDMASQYLSRTAGDARYLPKSPSPFMTPNEMQQYYQPKTSYSAYHKWDETDTYKYTYIKNKPALTSRSQLQALIVQEKTIPKYTVGFIVDELARVASTDIDIKTKHNYVNCKNSTDYKIACAWSQMQQSTRTVTMYVLRAGSQDVIQYDMQVPESFTSEPGSFYSAVEPTRHSLYWWNANTIYRFDAYTGELISTLDMSELGIINRFAAANDGNTIAVSLQSLDKKQIYDVYIYRVTDDGFTLLKVINGTTAVADVNGDQDILGYRILIRLVFNPQGDRLFIYGGGVIGGGALYDVTNDNVVELANLGIKLDKKYGYIDSYVLFGYCAATATFSGDGKWMYAMAGDRSTLKTIIKAFDVSQDRLDNSYPLEWHYTTSTNFVNSDHSMFIYKDIMVHNSKLFKLKGRKALWLASDMVTMEFDRLVMGDDGIGMGFYGSYVTSTYPGHIYSTCEMKNICYIGLDAVKDYDKYIIAFSGSTNTSYKVMFDYVATIDNSSIDGMILKSCTPGSNKKFRISIGSDGQLTTTEYIE